MCGRSHVSVNTKMSGLIVSTADVSESRLLRILRMLVKRTDTRDRSWPLPLTRPYEDVAARGFKRRWSLVIEGRRTSSDISLVALL